MTTKSKPKVTVFFFHLRSDKEQLYQSALEGLNVRLVPIYKPGRSSVYASLARSLRAKGGSVVKGLLKIHRIHDPGLVAMCSYSAGYGATREALTEDDHGVQLVVGIDSFYAGLDPDGTAADKDVAALARFAGLARDGLRVLWLGYGDVPIASYASTAKVVAEVKRLAGEPTGAFYAQGFNVARDHGAEHAMALTKWGPKFLAGAVKELQLQRSTSTPEQHCKLRY
jgi:hypothetical protein